MRATWIENMREAKKVRYERMINWHPYFAILPVWVGEHDCRWMEWIERRCEYVGAYDGTHRFDTFRAKPSPA